MASANRKLIQNWEPAKAKGKCAAFSNYCIGDRNVRQPMCQGTRYGVYQCSNRGHILAEDGYRYCARHNPATMKPKLTAAEKRKARNIHAIRVGMELSRLGDYRS